MNLVERFNSLNEGKVNFSDNLRGDTYFQSLENPSDIDVLKDKRKRLNKVLSDLRKNGFFAKSRLGKTNDTASNRSGELSAILKSKGTDKFAVIDNEEFFSSKNVLTLFVGLLDSSTGFIGKLPKEDISIVRKTLARNKLESKLDVSGGSFIITLVSPRELIKLGSVDRSGNIIRR